MDQTVASEIVVPAEPAAVWGALTDPDELRQWFGAEVSIDPRPGGEVRAVWPGGRRAIGSVEVAEPGVRLAFRWRHVDRAGLGPRLGPASRVEIALEPVAEGTRVLVTEGPVDLAWTGGASR
jgi:uncharacterized protein YndB with AHSA1/START domain